MVIENSNSAFDISAVDGAVFVERTEGVAGIITADEAMMMAERLIECAIEAQGQLLRAEFLRTECSRLCKQ